MRCRGKYLRTIFGTRSAFWGIAVTGAILGFVPCCSVQASQAEDQLYAALLLDEKTLLENFPNQDTQDNKILMFGYADINQDGVADLIVSKKEPGSRRNGDSCFYTIMDGAPVLVGVQETDELQKIGYNADSGYVYLYTEGEKGEQTVDLLSFSGEPIDPETEKNNISVAMTFMIGPDKEGDLRYYQDGKEVSETDFTDLFGDYLGKEIPFFEDEYFYGWDGYSMAAWEENTPDNRLKVFGTNGSPEPETATEEATSETKVPEVQEPETTSSEMQAIETQVPETTEPETHTFETETAKTTVQETQEPELTTAGEEMIDNSADTQADWDAVNQARLTAGDPVTLSGDMFSDGTERNKVTGYILPQSACKYLTEEDIAFLSMKGCCYARNEIYARHGRIFNAVELQNFFGEMSWYDGYILPDDFPESALNEYELKNATFLWQYETDHGMYWPE